ncbi:Sodium- and chloride-dependent GABA transporter 2 [Nymphon striatum]|nr:Sodium- and chloride-dependent GABA transporter 2 [Nymphon striatum]
MPIKCTRSLLSKLFYIFSNDKLVKSMDFNTNTVDNIANNVRKWKTAMTQIEVVRPQWSGKLDFILSALGVAVGLGNIWRFPYICFKNGGAVFLIPYVIMLVFVGIPLYFLELALGQFCGKGAIETWSQSVPIFRGLGYATVINTAITAMYYMVLIAWTIFYIGASFQSVLPWSRCQLGYSHWADDSKSIIPMAKAIHTEYGMSARCLRDIKTELVKCYSKADEEYCINEGYTSYGQGQCLNSTNVNVSTVLGLSGPSEQYYKNVMLQLSPNMNQLGPLNWHLALCLLLGWIITYVCVIRGPKSIGKVAYFTSVFPYVALTVLLVRGATLPGAKEGINFYVVPDFTQLLKPQVWYDAAAQILYSLGCATGCIITFSSYNPFNNNCQRDAILISVANCLTSAYAGFAIFSILGFMANELGVPVGKVAAEGVGLAFIAYPEAVSRMSISQLWSVMFFFMILVLGIGTMVSTSLIKLFYFCKIYFGDEINQIDWFKIAIVIVYMISSLQRLQGAVHRGYGMSARCLRDIWYETNFFGPVSVVMTVLEDRWPSLIKKKWLVLGVLCLILYLIALPLVCESGVYLFVILVQYSGNALVFCGLFEVIGIAYIYGFSRFSADLKLMLGKAPSSYWKFTWVLTTPLLTLGIIIFSYVLYKPTPYNKEPLPLWLNAFGWAIFGVIISPIPVVAIYELATCKGNYKKLFVPTELWGPSETVPEIRKEYIMTDDRNIFATLANEVRGSLLFNFSVCYVCGSGYTHGKDNPGRGKPSALALQPMKKLKITPALIVDVRYDRMGYFGTKNPGGAIL